MAMKVFNPVTVKSSQFGPSIVLPGAIPDPLVYSLVSSTMSFNTGAVQNNSNKNMKEGIVWYGKIGPLECLENSSDNGSYTKFGFSHVSS